MKISTRFSGHNGIYVSVRPLKIDRLLQYASIELPVSEPLEKLHCTLVYSRDHAPDVLTAGKLQASGPKKYEAWCIGFDYWDGHDNAGYIVAKLDSPDLQKRHREWLRIGAKHSFPDYMPHITLSIGTKVPKSLIRKYSTPLEKCPIRLDLSTELIEDIKS